MSKVIFYSVGKDRKLRSHPLLEPDPHLLTVFVESNQEAEAGDRQIEWSPDSAEVNVNRPLAPP